MRIYSYLTAEETFEKVALLSREERTLLEKSEVARASKKHTYVIPESFWKVPKPFPAYHQKIMKEMTIRVGLKYNSQVRKRH